MPGLDTQVDVVEDEVTAPVPLADSLEPDHATAAFWSTLVARSSSFTRTGSTG